MVTLVPEQRVQQRIDEQTVDEQVVEVPLTQTCGGDWRRVHNWTTGAIFWKRISEQYRQRLRSSLPSKRKSLLLCRIVATGETPIMEGQKLEVVAIVREMQGDHSWKPLRLVRLIWKLVREETGRVCQRGLSFGSGTACCRGNWNLALRRSP